MQLRGARHWRQRGVSPREQPFEQWPRISCKASSAARPDTRVFGRDMRPADHREQVGNPRPPGPRNHEQDSDVVGNSAGANGFAVSTRGLAGCSNACARIAARRSARSPGSGAGWSRHCPRGPARRAGAPAAGDRGQLLHPFEIDDRHDPDQQVGMASDIDGAVAHGTVQALVDQQVRIGASAAHGVKVPIGWAWRAAIAVSRR